MKLSVTILLLIFNVNTTLSQSSFRDKDIIFENKVYDNNIHTVLLHPENNPLSYPIVHLGTEEKLQLSFDDFNEEDNQNYYYTLIHCNSDWTASDLMQQEYINGFFENKMEDYEFSFNTQQHYTHYNLIFPEEYLKVTLSGNYIIKVYNYQTNKVVLSKRFMMLEEKINISTHVKRATLIDEREYKQEIDFTINHSNIYFSNPYVDLKVIIKQNNREDNQIDNLKPLFIKKDQLIYNYESENTFEAGNEYRHFDIKSIRYQSERIKKIMEDSNSINVVLYTDISRSFDEFLSIPDINGNFLIDKQEAWNSEIEAEYVNVTFSLLENRKVTYGDIYLLGRFTDWNIDEKYKLIFNEESRKYECSSLLKQGYYNYLYLLKDNSNQHSSLTFIEGSHYQTKNDYYIYVYYREIGKTYDQLIGYIKTSSVLF